jgi:hypothetical protein
MRGAFGPTEESARMSRSNPVRKTVHPDVPDPSPEDPQSVPGDDYGVELFEEDTPEGDHSSLPFGIPIKLGETDESPAESLIEPASAGIAQMFDNFHEDSTRPAPIPAPKPTGQPDQTIALLPGRKRILYSGLLGAMGGFIFCVTMWVAGSRTPNTETLDDDGPALGAGEPAPTRIDGFAAIARALELAEARKYADAVMAIDRAPLATSASKSSPEVLNRHELVEHW